MPLSRNRKNYVLDRDDNKCVYCGTTYRLTVDHIMPRSKGGSNDLSNLQTLCEKCNGDKADKIPQIITQKLIDNFKNLTGIKNRTHGEVKKLRKK